MGGLSALHPWLLLGALAALVPLIIHLIERRRVKRVVFGSVIFLRGLVKRMARRRRTSELILLLVRMALVAVLAVAFARPLLRSGDVRGPGGRRAVAILVDRSGSMAIGTRMADARAKALAVIDGLRRGDQLAVFAFGARVAPVVAWTEDRAVARAAVEKLAACDEATDLAGALREVSQIAAGRVEPNRSVVVVSDLQASGWAGYAGDWTMPPGVDLALERVGADEVPSNVGIVKLAVPAQAVVGSGEEVLAAQVRNAGDERRSVKVALELGGKEVDSREISLPADAAASVSFRHAFDAPGETPGRFVLSEKMGPGPLTAFPMKSGDPFSPDDRAGFVVDVKPKIGVVLVNGSGDADPKRNDGYYLKRALSPTAESIFAVTETRPQDLAAARLGEASVVVLADVDDLSADAQRKLRQFVQSGGGVMIFPGTQTNPANFNRALADVAPCLLEKQIAAGSPDDGRRDAVISDVDFTHPVFSPFAGPHHGDFSRVGFSRTFAVTDSQAATVLARFDSGRPAVLIKPIGRGASLMVVSGADLEMNNFALRAVFLPFVHQAARHLAAFGMTRDTAFRVGDLVTVDAPPGIADAPLTSPSGATARVAVESGDPSAAGARVIRFTAAEPGFYKLDLNGAERLFAANVNPAEGELACMRPDEIAASLTARRGEEEGGTRVVEGRRITDEDVERSQRTGWWLLIAVAALLAVEMTLARQIAAEQA